MLQKHVNFIGHKRYIQLKINFDRFEGKEGKLPGTIFVSPSKNPAWNREIFKTPQNNGLVRMDGNNTNNGKFDQKLN